MSSSSKSHFQFFLLLMCQALNREILLIILLMLVKGLALFMVYLSVVLDLLILYGYHFNYNKVDIWKSFIKLHNRAVLIL